MFPIRFVTRTRHYPIPGPIPATSFSHRPRLAWGVVSVEYVLIAAVVVGFAVTGVYLIGQSTSSIDQLSSRLSGFKAHDTTLLETTPFAEFKPSLNQELSAFYGTAVRTRMFVACSCLMVTLMFGLLYLRQKRHREPQPSDYASAVPIADLPSNALKTVVNKRRKFRNMFRHRWDNYGNGTGRVGDFMSTDVVAVPPDMTIGEADSLLKDNGFRRVMVVQANQQFAGVLSRIDILSKTGELVADIMTDKPKTAAPEMDIQVALSIILQHRVSCLPVVHEGQLVGLISTSDMLVILHCLLATLNEQSAVSFQ